MLPPRHKIWWRMRCHKVNKIMISPKSFHFSSCNIDSNQTQLELFLISPLCLSLCRSTHSIIIKRFLKFCQCCCCFKYSRVGLSEEFFACANVGSTSTKWRPAETYFGGWLGRDGSGDGLRKERARKEVEHRRCQKPESRKIERVSVETHFWVALGVGLRKAAARHGA